MGKMKPVDLRRVRITDGFWKARQRCISEVSIPYMEKILNDEIPDAPRSHAIANFKIAAGEESGEFYGMVFQDTDVYKWIEATAYSLACEPDAALESRMDRLIDTVAAAQRDDGYLNTYFILKDLDKRWTNLLECHELYCAGHLMEAACACYEALGKETLLRVAEKLADHIIKVFSSEGIPGHEEIEIGLMRLYHVTEKKEYLNMAFAFLDRRGRDTAYFSAHTPAHPGFHYGEYDIDPADPVYNQTYAPIRLQKTAEGHAVRMMYLLTAMADVALEAGDDGMRKACEKIFRNTVDRRMYVTGGLGTRALHESFGEDYELPNATAYNETCASVAMSFFMRNMLRISPEGEYADVLEKELYNGALASMQLDGTRYFYVNPLEADPADKSKERSHVLLTRPPWYACACCPPNLARLILSLGKYLWTETDDTVYSHLFVGNRAETELADIRLETGYPWQGKAVYTIIPKTQKAFTLAVHKPVCADHVLITVNRMAIPAREISGYLYVTRVWGENDRMEVAFDLLPRRIYADEAVICDRGLVAFAYGPFIYCAEQIDQSEELARIRIPKDAAIRILPYEETLLKGIRPMETEGIDRNGNTVKVRLIPYYTWSNRGETAMRVWLREL